MPKLADLNLASFTATDLSQMIAVVPFASLEPVGHELPLGIFQRITETVSDSIAELQNCIVLPQITTPYATPFQGFRGVISLRRNVFMNVLADTALSLSAMGFGRVLFLDGTCYAKSSIDEAMKKFKRSLPEKFSYGIVSWQSESSMKTVFSDSLNLKERWRSEALAVQLFCEITGSPVPESFKLNTNISDKQFESWRKRTRDPELLRKYFPEAHLSSWDKLVVKEPILPKITKSICETIEKGYIFHGL